MDNYTDRGYNNLLSVDSTKDISGGINLGNIGAVSDSVFGFNKLNIRKLQPNQDMQTADFESGVSGWQIKGDGNAEFNNGVFRGALSASTIDIGGSDTSSFHVDIDGNIWSGAATFNQTTNPFSVSKAGNLSVVGGTIVGSTIKSGTSGDRVEIDSDGVIQTFNSSGASVVTINPAATSGYYLGYAAGTTSAVYLFAKTSSSANILKVDGGDTSGNAFNLVGGGNTNDYLALIETGAGSKGLLKLKNTSTNGYALARFYALDLDKNGVFISNSESANPQNEAILEVKEYSNGLSAIKATAAYHSCMLLDCDNSTGSAHIRMVGKTGNPTSPVEGDIWYDATTHTLKYYNGSATKTVATV
jgi:hypothetical protein